MKTLLRKWLGIGVDCECVRITQLQPGDLLLVKLREQYVTQELIEELQAKLRGKSGLPDTVHIMVVAGGPEISIIRPPPPVFCGITKPNFIPPMPAPPPAPAGKHANWPGEPYGPER